MNGALGRNRTGTALRPTDFKSAASTCSATSASTEMVIQRKNNKCNIKLESYAKICLIKDTDNKKYLCFAAGDSVPAKLFSIIYKDF